MKINLILELLFLNVKLPCEVTPGLLGRVFQICLFKSMIGSEVKSSISLCTVQLQGKCLHHRDQVEATMMLGLCLITMLANWDW